MKVQKNRALRRKFSSSLMSDAKWRKLYLAMVEHGSQLCGIRYKLTDEEQIYVGSAPFLEDIWETCIDNPVEGLGGPIEYKHIESISIPYFCEYRRYDRAPVSRTEQSIEAFVQALEKLGDFPVSLEDECIVIRAYET